MSLSNTLAYVRLNNIYIYNTFKLNTFTDGFFFQRLCTLIKGFVSFRFFFLIIFSISRLLLTTSGRNFSRRTAISIAKFSSSIHTQRTYCDGKIDGRFTYVRLFVTSVYRKSSTVTSPSTDPKLRVV